MEREAPISRRDLFKAGVAGAIGLVVGKAAPVSAEVNDLNDIRAQAQVAYRQGVDAEQLLINFAGMMMGQRFYVPPLEDYRLIFEDAVSRVGGGEDPMSISLWSGKLNNPNVASPSPSLKPK